MNRLKHFGLAFRGKRLLHLKKIPLARNAMWLFLGQGGNLLLQAGSFIILARLLGVAQYGVFAGAFALVNLLTPYSALGSAMLFMRYVSLDRSHASIYWGNALSTIASVSMVIALGLMLCGPHLVKFPGSASLFFILTLSNCLFSQVALTASRVFQTFEKMRHTALISSLTNLARFLVLLCMLFWMRHATAMQWGYGILIASILAAAASLFLVHREIGFPGFNFGILFIRAKEGLGFSFAGTTQSAYNDLDKTLLSRYGFNRENGFYTLAYRAIDVASAPIAALDSSVLPRFFQLGSDGILPIARLAWKSLRVAIVLGFAIAAITLLAAPVIPLLVGRDFSGALQVLRWLCWLPLMRGIHCLAGSALTGSGRQNQRTAAQIFVAVLNLLLNLVLIPRWGWIGAAFSSLVSDGMLAVCNVALLCWVARAFSRSRSHLTRSTEVHVP